MKLSELTRQLCKDAGISLSELARRTNQLPSSLSRKLTRETVSFEEFQEFIRVTGANVEMKVTTKSGNEVSAGAELDSRVQQSLEILQDQINLEKKKNKFLYEMNHDFRTSFEVITAATSLAIKYKNNPEKLNMYLEKIRSAESTIVTLINRSYMIMGDNTEFSAVTEASSGDTFSLNGARVLLVDDSKVNREIIKEILEESGAFVHEASDGDEAVKKISASKAGFYSVVLMDIEMPNMNGYEATRAIRSLPDKGLADIPIIALTANAFSEDCEKAVDAGMNYFLTKPVEMKKLLSAIINFIR